MIISPHFQMQAKDRANNEIYARTINQNINAQYICDNGQRTPANAK